MKLEDKIRPHALLWDCYNDEPEKYNHTNKLTKIAEQHAIEFAKWCLRNIKKAPSSKKYVFKHQNKVVADEHTIGEIYKVFIIDKEYYF